MSLDADCSNASKCFTDGQKYAALLIFCMFDANSCLRSMLRESERKQKEFRSLVRNHGGFSEDEKSALQVDSVAAFDTVWKSVIDSKTTLEASRGHGIRKGVQKTQNFFASTSEILQHLEPMLELVRNLGAPYGGMAIGTISFLFIVRKIKLV